MAEAEHPPADPAQAAAQGEVPLRPEPDMVGPKTAVDLLIEETRLALGQELDLVWALAAAGALTGRNVALLGATAILVALVALMTLAIGVMLAIAANHGFWVAAAIVAGVLGLILAILAVLIRRAIARFQSAARGDRS